MSDQARDNQPHGHPAEPPKASLDIALRYVEVLTGDAETPMAFTLLDDKKRQGNRPEILFGPLRALFARMQAKNTVGYGVFVAVNRLREDAKGNRNAKNVEALRAVFTDNDEGEDRTPNLSPSFTVYSARGAHRYWVLTEGEPLALFTAAQEHLAAAFDSDPRVIDLPRLMRVPGFLHQKGEPLAVTMKDGTLQRHTIAEVLKAHPVSADELAAFRAKHKAGRKMPTVDMRSNREELVTLPPMKVRKKRAERYLARVPVAVEGEGGDCQTYRAACIVVCDFAVDKIDDAMDVLRRWNASCVPPWDEEELAAKAWSALRSSTGVKGSKLARKARLRGETDKTPPVPHCAQKEDQPDQHLCGAVNEDQPANDPPLGGKGAPQQDASGDSQPTDFASVPPAQTDDFYLAFLEILANRRSDALGDNVVAELARLSLADPKAYAACIDEAKLSGPGLVQDLKRAVKAKCYADSAAEAAREFEDAAIPVIEAVPAARAVVSDEHEVPNAFEMSSTGIVKLVEKKYRDFVEVVRVPLCDRPIVVTAILEKNDASGTLLEIAFVSKRTGEWVKLRAPRNIVRTSRLINELALHNLPVHSGTAQLLVEFLAEYEDRNDRVIPRRTAVVQMGWHKSSEHDVFVVGHECFTPKEDVMPVTFHAASDGDEHLANCLHSNGTLAGCQDAMRLIAKYPRVELAVYAALAPPLMDIVNAPSFAIDFCGESSTGKTTTMRIAAACWGVPDERSRHSFIHSWNTTQVGLERLAATLNGLPVFMDETKQAPTGPRGKCIVPECIYQMTNGKGRTRGAIEGRRKTLYWNTLLMTTGEKAAVDHSKDAGPAARLLTLWGSPFGGYSEDVATIEALVRDNYGHAGPIFARWLVEKRAAHADEWRALYRALVVQLKIDLATTLDGGVADRLAKYLALLDLPGRLARQVIEIPGSPSACIDGVLADVAKGAAPFDRPLEALLHCYHVAVAEKASFFGCHDSNHPPPRFNGYWRVRRSTGDNGDDYEYIGFMQDYLDRILTSGGFDSKPTVNLWHERGWLKSGSGKHRTLRVRLNGERPHVIAVSRQAIETALNTDC